MTRKMKSPVRRRHQAEAKRPPPPSPSPSQSPFASRSWSRSPSPTSQFVRGLVLRLFIASTLPILLDSNPYLRGVKYTDVDYSVFSDAARHVRRGESPYARHTYRYTPFLAAVLAVTEWKLWGKFLFCLADAICGHLIVLLRRSARDRASSSSDAGVEASGTVVAKEGDDRDQKKEEVSAQVGGGTSDKVEAEGSGQIFRPPATTEAEEEDEIRACRWDAIWWLYNPLPINICTRGSAESLVVLLPVLSCVAIAASTPAAATATSGSRRGRANVVIMARAALCGAVHGLAVHAKLYPIIYTASFAAHFSRLERGPLWAHARPTEEDEDVATTTSYWLGTQGRNRRWTALSFVLTWIRRFLLPSPLLFVASSVSTFALLTFAAVRFYGPRALNEGLLYHFGRVDHRHNYSPYWYPIYLALAKDADDGGDGGGGGLVRLLGLATFVPQAILLLSSSLGVAPYDLTFALFLQTFLFVALNKVITAQYFVWYLCLLPLCSGRIGFDGGVKRSLGLLGLSVVVWLATAFSLEMLGRPAHLEVWGASLGFFGANVAVLCAIVGSYVPPCRNS